MAEGLTGRERRRPQGVHRSWRSSVVALAVAIGALVCSSSPALALSQRGHSFGFSFASAAPGELSSIAVNESTHEVYVVNRVANTVEQFKQDGEGKYVLHATIGSVPVPGYVAVDNSKEPSDPSAGDVYVASRSPKGGAVYKFDPAGTQIAKIARIEQEGEAKPFGKILGMSVGPSGSLWVYQDFLEEAQVDRLNNAIANMLLPPIFEIAGFLENPVPGFAVKPSEDIFYAGQSAESAEEAKEHGAKTLCTLSPCTIAEAGTFSEGELNSSGEPLESELVSQDTSAVAVDLFGEGSSHAGAEDIYLDNVTGVTVLSASNSLVQRLGSKGSNEPGFGGLQEGSGIAIDSATGDVFVVDEKAGLVDVFPPRPADVRPEVDSFSATNVTSDSAALTAQVDPIGSETEYSFQYSTTAPVSCPHGALPACEAPVSPGRLPGVFGDQGASAMVTGLEAGVEYHYRVVATNKFGTLESEERTFVTPVGLPSESVLPDSRRWEMVSPPNKHGAGIEPMLDQSAPIQAAANGEAIAYVADSPTEEAPEGNRNYEPTQLLSTRGSSGWESKDISTRDETSHGPPGPTSEYSLFSPDLSLALVYPYPGGSSLLAEPALSPRLGPGEVQEKTVYLRADAPTPPEASSSAIYQAASENGAKMGNPGYLALVNGSDDTTGKPFGQTLKVDGATPDLSHVALSSTVALTSSPESKGLYEWSAGTLPGGQLQLVSLLPNSTTPDSSFELGGSAGFDTRHAISNGGSRVFWTGGQVLYMRDLAKQQTVQLSAVQGTEEVGEGAPAAVYQTASPDGSKVLFTDSQRLSKEAGAAGQTDLYECEIVELLLNEHEEDECNLTDLTPEHEGASADVLGAVIGASEEDLSRVYFVANGVLSENHNAAGEQAEKGNCVAIGSVPPRDAMCNLYVHEPVPEHPGQYRTTFIARLSGEDAPDWEAVAENLANVTASVSPSGEYLAFMSSRSLTGYDNTDVNSGQPDEEVYLYNAGTGHLFCASCNPSGARPTGVLDTPESGEGVGLLVDRRGTWGNGHPVDHWLAGSVPGWTPDEFGGSLYQSRYLSNSGRLFFNSADALVPQDTNSKEDVYEYEPPSVGGCTSGLESFSAKQNGCISLISSGTSSRESTFLDASETGGDVFFLTSASLVPGDLDTSFDMYDAHECASACPPPPSAKAPSRCEAEASEATCRSESPPVSTLGSPSSTTFSGAGNIVPAQRSLPFKTTVKPPTRAQLLAKALKVCRRKKNKAKRVKCERQARKRYGPIQAKKATAKRDSRANGNSR